MEIYIAVLVIILILDRILKPENSIKRKKCYAIIIFIMLGGLSALRKYTVGNDLHYQYYGYFIRMQNVSWAQLFSMNTRYEPGFLSFLKIIGSISSNPQFMIASHSIIVIGYFCHFFYRYCERITIAVFLFVTMNHWFQSMVIMRQMLAVCLALLGTEILIKKSYGGLRFIPVVLLDLVAISMHYSAIIVFAFIIINYLHFNNGTFVFFSILGTVLFFSRVLFEWIVDFMESVLTKYNFLNEQYFYFSHQILEKSRYNMSGIYAFVPYLLTFVCSGLLLLNWRVRIKIGNGEIYHGEPKRYDDQLYSNDFLMYSVLLVVLFRILSFSFPVIARFSQYFIVFEYVLLGRILNEMKRTGIRQFTGAAIIIVTSIAFIMMNSDIRLNSVMTGTVPYKFFWQ